jgi:hypothetical protein
MREFAAMMRPSGARTMAATTLLASRVARSSAEFVRPPADSLAAACAIFLTPGYALAEHYICR